MPSILFLTRALDIGGAQRQLIELACGLHTRGWPVHVLLFYGGGALESGLRERGVPTTCLNKRGRWDVLGFSGRLLKALRTHRADIVHGYLDVSNILLTACRPFLGGARIVWGVRASDVDYARYDLSARCVFRVARFAARFADLIICNSVAGRTYHIAHGYPADRVVVVPNGIDVQRFRPDLSARHEVRQSWSIAPHERVVGLIARLDPMKDHPSFLRAAAAVAEERDDVKFACIGDGPASYRDTLMRTADALGLGARLLWQGARTDMPRVYNALDVLVSSSAFGEGTSNTIAEAMATGVTCVVTDVGDSKTLVGDVGWTCPPGDSPALASTMLKALSAVPAAPAEIRRRIVRDFSLEGLVQRTADHLNAVVPATRGVTARDPTKC